PPPVRAPSRGSPSAAQRRPVVDGSVGERRSASQLSSRERPRARRALPSAALAVTEGMLVPDEGNLSSVGNQDGTAESARRPPPERAPSRGSLSAARRRPVVDGLAGER